jgi:ferredoxin, 2Fe-2S
MPKITVLPHETLCPEGTSFELAEGSVLCDGLLDQHIDIEHACDKSCACTA